MGPSSADSGVVRFDAFEADLRAGELRKRGRRIKLEGKPFQVLAVLIRRPGELVTREDLQAELWSADTFVEFDHGLNTAVNKVRAALGDSARDPKFIETLHRRGYRFIGKIEPPGGFALQKPAPILDVPRPASLPRPIVSLRGAVMLAAVSAVVGVAFGVYLTRGAPQRATLQAPVEAAPKPEIPPAEPALAEPSPAPTEPLRIVQSAPAPPPPPPPDEAPEVRQVDSEEANIHRIATAIGAIWGGARRQQLAWVDRSGRRLEPVGGMLSSITYPSLSPDERSVTATVGRDVWVQDLNGASSTRISGDRHRDVLPLWSPSGDAVLYSAHQAGDRNVYVRPADASRPVLRLTSKSLGGNVVVFDWSRNGRYIVYRQENRGSQADIGYLERVGFDYEQHSFLHSGWSEGEPKLSPDSRYIAYCSDESGRREVYVSAFPSGEGKIRVSDGGGTQPRWSRDGSELFFVKRDALMAAPITTERALVVGPVQYLFQHDGLRSSWPSQQYDVSADSQRFLVIERVKPVQAGASIQISPIPLG